MKSALIYVPDDAVLKNQNISDALFLCQSIVDSPIILWDSVSEPKEVLKGFNDVFSRIIRVPDSKREFGLLKYLDSFSLQDNILIVSLGSTDVLNRYIYQRAKIERTLNLRWNIVSSDYARFSLLEKQRPLSDFVPMDTQIWTKKLIDRFGKTRILESLDVIELSKTIVIGESIIDEYIYCDALGKVSKDPIVAFQKKDSVRQAGGAIAAARHFAGLGSTTLLLSELGIGDRSLLNMGSKSGEPIDYDLESEFTSIVKSRYVDRSSGTRVFETYDLPSNYESLNFHKRLSKLLNSRNFEGVNFVVMDYGHGLISDDSVKLLLNSNLDLSVNTQSNAGNRGFNSISRYQGAKKAFLNGGEVQLEAKNRNSDLGVVVESLARNLNFHEVYVTNGSRGIIAFSAQRGTFRAPAFAPSIVDRVGAGDATLAVISALRAVNVPMEIASFYGNIAGALLLSSLGNEVTITKQLLSDEASKILRNILSND